MTQHRRPSKHNRLSPAASIVLPVIILVGFAVRLYGLGAQSLWYDETVSAYLATEPVAELVAHTARDIHPPGYYLLLHGWVQVAGRSEFALAFFSLVFGVLLIPLTYWLARLLAGRATAVWAAALVAASPYHLWYSQEVRMYTLGAALGLVAAGCALRALTSRQPRYAWIGYVAAAALGLYSLYYFAFLLLTLNLFFLAYLLQRRKNLLAFVIAHGLVLAAYLPWVPVAWRQVTSPPVPAWRSAERLWPALLESWSALSLGQSVEPAVAWPMLLLTLVLFGLGLSSLRSPAGRRWSFRPGLLLGLYTFAPLGLIYLVSLKTPLYHVRYVFIYSPAFYILVGAGLAWLARPQYRWLAGGAAGLLLLASAWSSYRFQTDPHYQADDYRAAVAFIETHWQPGDALLVNAGYTYTAFVYYANIPGLERRRLVPYQPPAPAANRPLLLQTGTVDGSPQLGWGAPQADFYRMSSQETIAALEHLAGDYQRLWLLRAYDTVTDPEGLIRAWLAGHAIPLEDQPFTGESSIRAQGFLLAGHAPPAGQPVLFQDGMALAAWSLPQQVWQPGQALTVKLWWQVTAPPGADYKMSLKLWTASGQLAAQGRDDWPAGSLYRATDWPVGQPVYQPATLTLPPELPPGQYWLNVELYHPDTVQPLPLLTGEAALSLGPVQVGELEGRKVGRLEDWRRDGIIR